MFKAKYIQRGDAIDYIPQTNTDAGSVVFIGALCGITKLDIKAGELGALAVTGVFEFIKASGTAISAGDYLYWDADNGRVTTSSNSYALGVAIADAASADTAVRVLINAGGPEPDESSSST